MSPDFLLQVFIALSSAAGVYAGIKSDLTRSILLAEEALKHAVEARSDAKTAHVRMSAHVENFHTEAR